jgi:hypothetical protein
MYDEPTRFCLFGLDSGFSGSGKIDEVEVEVAVDVSVEGDGTAVEGDETDENFEGCGFAQQLERVPLSFFEGGIICICVCVCEYVCVWAFM